MQYKQGTVTVTNGSNIITGSGTAWLANVGVGDWFKVDDIATIYQVASVDSDTQIHLSVNYAGSNSAGLAYCITRDFTAVFTLPLIYRGDIDWPDFYNRAMSEIDEALDGLDILLDDHSARHENGGADEISVIGLSGLLADAQTPLAHDTSHENGGADEISVAGLSGELADPQPPKIHASSHQNGGGDEISVAGLSGELADAQPPKAHASTHAEGGSDPVATHFNPELYFEFYEDFSSFDNSNDPIFRCANIWTARYVSSVTYLAGTGGRIRMVGDTINGPWVCPQNQSSVFVASQNPVFMCNVAQYGTSAGTRRIGLTIVGTPLDADPANGIYFRHTVGGNIYAVCRSASAESTLDTGIVAANGVYHKLKLVITGTTNVEVFVDGVSKGSIITNIPSVGLNISAGNSGTAVTDGMDIDFIYVRQNR